MTLQIRFADGTEVEFKKDLVDWQEVLNVVQEKEVESMDVTDCVIDIPAPGSAIFRKGSPIA